MPVNPGDFIKGDDDGVVVIPADLIENTIRRALERLKKEREWFTKLDGGADTFDILGLSDE